MRVVLTASVGCNALRIAPLQTLSDQVHIPQIHATLLLMPNRPLAATLSRATSWPPEVQAELATYAAPPSGAAIVPPLGHPRAARPAPNGTRRTAKDRD
jgi:hypothetical protein